MKIHIFTCLLLCSLLVNAAPPTPASAAGIFGVGFTNVTDSSARLVFTTTEPMSSTVMVTDHDKEALHLTQSTFDEIHAVDLTGLMKGGDYVVTISATTHDGKTVTSEKIPLKPELGAPSSHAWPGYTIIGTTVVGNRESDGLDLLAQSGARMARIEASWYDLFPKGPEVNPVYLQKLVHQVDEMKKRQVEPLVVLDYCVSWAKPLTATTMTWRNPAFGPPDRLEDWNRYVRTVVTALRGSVKYYEVWNEPDAGYLATGNYVERPNLPPPIGRAPFKDNWTYWLGDRFVPMIAEVRKVLNELDPGALVMNGGWNRDYTGQRGDLLLDRGVAPSLDIYAFHCYSAAPMSFARWHQAIDGGFRKNIDRIFQKHHVDLPLAVTEWGWPTWSDPQPGKGFVSFEDGQKFLVKSTFYFLGLQRMEMLSQFCLGIGPAAREQDPSFFTLVDSDASGKEIVRSTFPTFRWIATTFSNKSYRALPVQVTPSKQVTAVAIQLKDGGDTYLAVWQDGTPDSAGAITAQPEQTVTIALPDLPGGQYTQQILALDGTVLSTSKVDAHQPFTLTATLPAISATAESGIYLAKISAAK